MDGGFDSLAASLTLALVVCGGLALALTLTGAARLARGRLLAGGGRLVFALAFALAFALGASLGINLRTWQRLTHESAAAEIVLYQVRPQYFSAEIRLPDGSMRLVDLAGDDWQFDARVLKWTGFATVLGFDTLWRLERISGRWRDVAKERAAERTVHVLGESRGVDLWELARRWQWLPWADAVYGSATYLPMADQARYAVTVSASGLVARPANDAALRAVAEWR
jgi:hypothetical protein